MLFSAVSWLLFVWHTVLQLVELLPVTDGSALGSLGEQVIVDALARSHELMGFKVLRVTCMVGPDRGKVSGVCNGCTLG
jgi:hypothetical protein